MATKKYLSYDRLQEYDALIKAEISGGDKTTLSSAKTYADETANAVKNDLLNGAGEAYDTLKELGDLISENVDAIDALEIIATGKQDKITGVAGQYVSFDENGNVIAIDVASTEEVTVPSAYQSYLEQAKLLYDGDYKNIAILEESQYITVAFLMDDFTVTEYNKSSTEFKASGWVAASCKKSDSTWEVKDWRETASSGYNFVSNISNSSCYWYYNGNAIYPVNSSSAGEKVTGREFEMLDGSTVVAAIGAEIFNDYENNKATGEYSHAEGNNTVASGDHSHAEGYETVASGAYGAHAEGDSTVASNDSAHAEGYWTQAIGWASHAEGEETMATHDATHAEGWETLAGADYAHAEGMFTTAGYYGAHSEGENTFAAGYVSHAEGYGDATNIQVTETSNNKIYTVDNFNDFYIHENSFIYYSDDDFTNMPSKIVECNKENLTIKLDNSLRLGDGVSKSVRIYANGIAGGYASHTEGGYNIALAQYAHAEGWNTRAYGQHSHAEGYGTHAAFAGQHVQGEHNIRDTAGTADFVRGEYAHIVGNGTNDENRSNAHTLDWQGNAWFAGDVYVGSTSGTNRDDGSKKLVTVEEVNELIGSGGSGGKTTITIKTWTAADMV